MTLYAHGLGNIEKKFAFNSLGLNKFDYDMNFNAPDEEMKVDNRFSNNKRIDDIMRTPHSLKNTKIQSHSPFLNSKTKAILN